MRKTGLIILMTAAALSMSACGRNEKPESTKPSGTVANEKETVKKTEKETEKATEKKPVEIARNSSGMVFFSLTSSIASTVVSNKPIVSKTTEGYQSIYRSTSETIMPFIPVICMYFGDGICPKAYGIYSEDVIIDRII